MLYIVEVKHWKDGKVDVYQRVTDKRERNISRNDYFYHFIKRVFKTEKEADEYAQSIRNQNEKTE